MTAGVNHSNQLHFTSVPSGSIFSPPLSLSLSLSLSSGVSHPLSFSLSLSLSPFSSSVFLLLPTRNSLQGGKCENIWETNTKTNKARKSILWNFLANGEGGATSPPEFVLLFFSLNSCADWGAVVIEASSGRGRVEQRRPHKTELVRAVSHDRLHQKPPWNPLR